MKNRVDFKRCLLAVLLTTFVLAGIVLIKEKSEYDRVRKLYDKNIATILNTVLEKYPLIDEKDLLSTLLEGPNKNDDILKKYGIDIEKEASILEIDCLHDKFLILDAAFVIFTVMVISIIYIYYINDKEKKIKEITALIERINEKDYSLDIDRVTEDELSILKSELYKTTIMLKEQAENSLKDKLSLKDSLSDISHQLKTPLTSIMISIDNLLDNPDMSEMDRVEFLKTIKRENANIDFLVQSLLKLSRLDTNTVHFLREEVTLEKLVNSSIEAVSLLADLNDNRLVKRGNFSSKVTCDPVWQKEAIANILKNAIEHSPEGSPVTIEASSNKIYSSIAIKNEGEPIDKKDIPRLFERFYRGKNASKESVGIGLALAKSIVKVDGGNIEVESSKSGTTFTIKYYKR